MMTWKLWRALRQPPRKHPLYTQITQLPGVSLMPPGPLSWATLMIVFIAALWYAPRSVVPILLSSEFLLFLLLLSTGTLYSCIWAATTARIIARLREQGRYDLLCLSSGSSFSINWIAFTGAIYRRHSLPRINDQRSWIARMLLVLPASLILPIFLGFIAADSQYVLNLLSYFMYALVIGLAYHIDHIQSTILGGLIGMHIPQRNNLNTFEASVLAMGVFLLIQFLGYAVAVALCFDVLPSLIIGTTSRALLLPVLQLLTFAACREACILVLWSTLMQRLGSDMIETDLTFA